MILPRTLASLKFFDPSFLQWGLGLLTRELDKAGSLPSPVVVRT
jgi:hypothetical protein